MESGAYYKSPWMTEPDIADDYGLLNQHGEELSFDKNSTVYDQGDVTNDYIYFLLKGRIRIVSVSSKGEEKTLSILEAGVFFGEAAFFDHEIRFASAEAVVPSVVLRFDRKSAMALLSEKPEYYKLLFKSMSQIIRLLSGMVEDLTFWPIEKRLCRLLLRLISDFGTKKKRGGGPLGYRYRRGTVSTDRGQKGSRNQGFGKNAQTGFADQRKPAVVFSQSGAFQGLYLTTWFNCHQKPRNLKSTDLAGIRQGCRKNSSLPPT